MVVFVIEVVAVAVVVVIVAATSRADTTFRDKLRASRKQTVAKHKQNKNRGHCRHREPNQSQNQTKTTRIPTNTTKRPVAPREKTLAKPQKLNPPRCRAHSFVWARKKNQKTTMKLQTSKKYREICIYIYISKPT